MPTQSTTYNSRVTDEALEKRFRDTFRSQGGAELVDDLYAQGVIVPIVDFTAAATGQQLAENLQTAWDFSTTNVNVNNTSSTVTSTAGFYKVGIRTNEDGAGAGSALVSITDGLTTKTVWRLSTEAGSSGDNSLTDEFVVFLRSGDSLTVQSTSIEMEVNLSARQIATVSGDLIDPSGFTSS